MPGASGQRKKRDERKKGAAQKEVPLLPPFTATNAPPSFLGQVEEPQRKKNPAASSRDRKEEKEGGERKEGGGAVTQPSCNGHEYDEARRCLFFAHFSSDKFHPLFVAVVGMQCLPSLLLSLLRRLLPRPRLRRRPQQRIPLQRRRREPPNPMRKAPENAFSPLLSLLQSNPNSPPEHSKGRKKRHRR